MAQNGIRHIIKGHEHVPKVWQADRTGNVDLTTGRKLTPGDKVYLDRPSIVQLGNFDGDHYAILEENSPTTIEFRTIKEKTANKIWRTISRFL
ncbi:hypothetical protein GF354_04490 [Candidatus Peregrinibacteria bacterium]|nr:hypothetical protein [Candidatus Peregrinibacteria bacterium]